MGIHTPAQSDLLYVRIICHHGDEKEEGYITMVNEEDFTLGYNCELKHKMLNIPKVAVGVSATRTRHWWKGLNDTPTGSPSWHKTTTGRISSDFSTTGLRTTTISAIAGFQEQE